MQMAEGQERQPKMKTRKWILLLKRIRKQPTAMTMTENLKTLDCCAVDCLLSSTPLHSCPRLFVGSSLVLGDVAAVRCGQPWCRFPLFSVVLYIWKAIKKKKPGHLEEKLTIHGDNTVSTTAARLMTTSASYRWRSITEWNLLPNYPERD